MLERSRVLPHLIAELGERIGDTAAVIDVTGPAVTYRELDHEARKWAAAYRRAGLGAGETIVTMVPNSLDAYYAWLGAAWLNALEVPANNMYKGNMLRYLIENSEAQTVLLLSLIHISEPTRPY